MVGFKNHERPRYCLGPIVSKSASMLCIDYRNPSLRHGEGRKPLRKNSMYAGFIFHYDRNRTGMNGRENVYIGLQLLLSDGAIAMVDDHDYLSLFVSFLFIVPQINHLLFANQNKRPLTHRTVWCCVITHSDTYRK